MQELVLDVEKLIWRGRGLARLPSGQVVIIDPGVFPGERVRGHISHEQKDYLQLRWTGIERPARLRRPHPCPQAAFCGGCRFGVMPRREQLRLKQDLLIRELARSLGWREEHLLGLGLQVFQQDSPWRYRYRGQVHIANQAPHLKRFQSDELLRLNDCLLLARPLASRLQDLCLGMEDGRYTIAASPADGTALTEADQGPLALPFRDAPFDLMVPPQVFFQANWELNQDLIGFVRSRLQPFGRVADLFAGAGNFSLPLAADGHEAVLGLESDGRSVQAVRKSADSAGLSGLDIRRGDLRQSSVAELLRGKRMEAAVLDPPRSGAGKKLAPRLDQAGLKRLVWVSCDIVNTGRDLKPLLQNGGWSIQELALFDMFPHTWHMEAALVLDRATA